MCCVVRVSGLIREHVYEQKAIYYYRVTQRDKLYK